MKRIFTRITRLVLLTATLLLVITFSKSAQAVNVPQPGALMKDILNTDGTIKKGSSGSFNTAGYAMVYGKNSEPVFLSISGTWSTTFSQTTNGLNGDVKAIAIASNGDIYVGGTFTQAGGVNVNRIAKWNGKTWSALGSGVVGGGGFNTNNPVINVIAIDPDTLNGDVVYVGGAFTNAGGVSNTNGLAKWANGNWNSMWEVTRGFFSTFPIVNAIKIANDNLFIGGDFKEAGGVKNANFIVRLDLLNGVWDPLSGSCGSVAGTVDALAVDGPNETLYVGGQFYNAGCIPIPSGAQEGVYCIVKYIGRQNGVDINDWFPVGNYPSGTTPGAKNGTNLPLINAIVISGSNVYIGGLFTSVNSVPANNVAKLDQNGNWTSVAGKFSGNTTGTVFSLAVSKDGTGADIVYAGGAFAGGINKLNSSTWSSVDGGLNGAANAMIITNSTIFAGGAFTQAIGQAAGQQFHFSNITDDQITLPVTLTNYTIKLQNNGSVQSHWSTASETENSYFLLERSTDGKSFQQIGKISSKGNSGADYSFIDNNPVALQNNYYRLSQFNTDGTKEVLGIKAVNIRFTKSIGWSVNPNPVISNHIVVKLENYTKPEAKVTLTNMNGKIIYQNTVPVTRNEINVEFQKPVNGVYVLKVADLGAQEILVQ